MNELEKKYAEREKLINLMKESDSSFTSIDFNNNRKSSEKDDKKFNDFINKHLKK